MHKGFSPLGGGASENEEAETSVNWKAGFRYTDATISKDNAEEDLFVVDYISRYELNDSAVVFLKVENVFDEQAIVSRQADGARPNRPRTASIGLEWGF